MIREPLYRRAALAQLGERQTEDLKVPGSIPGGGIFAHIPLNFVTSTQELLKRIANKKRKVLRPFQWIDANRRIRAESQWIDTARRLYHVQYPVPNKSSTKDSMCRANDTMKMLLAEAIGSNRPCTIKV